VPVSIFVNTALHRRASERLEAGSPHKITGFNDFPRILGFACIYNKKVMIMIKQVEK